MLNSFGQFRLAMIDGEAVILDDKGRSSFAELQADLDKHGSERAVLYAFDLLIFRWRGSPRQDARGAPARAGTSRPDPPS